MLKAFNSIKQSLKKIKIEYVIIVVSVIAVIAIFASTFEDKSNNDDSTVTQYIEMLESKLSSKLSQIDGAGKVSVIISVKKGLTTEIATEKTTTNSQNGTVNEEGPVLVSGKPIVLSEVYPEICGVVVIAKGANNIKVKMSLMAATQTFLDVTSEKIEILTMR